VTLDSSGTSGPPKRTFFTVEDQQSIVTYFLHGLQLLASAGDRVLILLPGTRPGSAGDLLASAACRLGAVPFLGDLAAGVETLARTIEREEIHTVIGIPVHVLAIARYAAATGQVAGFPKSVLLCSDYIAGSAVQTIRRVWGCEVFGHYGTTERGLGGGIECHRHCGSHLREADLLFEIVDAVTGTPVAEGESGEVVFTTLTRRRMPLIRYRTGDISRFLPGPCDCGSPLRRLDRVGMRKDGAVSLGGGQAITIGALDEAVFEVQGVADFTAEVTGTGKRTLTIEISGVCGHRCSRSV
jgi:phenylacetate-coenzyme A ligase PaaK-like adenylate-forming protein